MSLATALPTLGYIILPLALATVAHTFFVRLDLLPWLKVPVSQRLFGANKTVRGFVVVPALTAVAVYAALPLEGVFGERLAVRFSEWSPWAIGLGLGLAYMLFELPNSFLKRRLGIAPGKRPTRYKPLFALLDQSDSVLGVLLFVWLFFPLPGAVLLLGVTLGVVSHFLVNILLFSVGLRSEVF